jgi:hypothetical protein
MCMINALWVIITCILFWILFIRTLCICLFAKFFQSNFSGMFLRIYDWPSLSPQRFVEILFKSDLWGQPTSEENIKFVGRSAVSVMNSFVVSLMDDSGTSSPGLPVRYVAEWQEMNCNSSEHLCFFCQSQEAESMSPSTFWFNGKLQVEKSPNNMNLDVTASCSVTFTISWMTWWAPELIYRILVEHTRPLLHNIAYSRYDTP